MAIDFPASPSVNDIHTSGGKRWTWNGTSWERSGTPGPGDTISATNDNTTSTLYPVLVTGTGSNTAKIATTSSKTVSFNASNGNLTATTFTGTLNTAAQPNITSLGTLGSLNVTGNATIGGVLTYEDVKNVDSVGIITARNDIKLTAAEGKLEATGATGLTLNASHASAYARIRTAGTERLRITSDGKVGIGSAIPMDVLDVHGNPIFGSKNTGDAQVTVGRGGSGNRNAYLDFIGDDTYTDHGLRVIRKNGGPNSESQITHRGTGDFTISTNEAATLRFATNNQERLRIKSNGFVGIGTDNPDAKLNVYRDDAGIGHQIQISQDGTGDATLGFELVGTRAWTMGIDNSDGDKFKISGGSAVDGAGDSNPRLIIATDGKIGIGSAAPTSVLDIVAADPVLTLRDTSLTVTNANATLRLAESDGNDVIENYWDVVADNTAGNFGFAIKQNLGGTTSTRFAIQPATGNIGIAQINPQHKLHVVGDIYASDDLIAGDEIRNKVPADFWATDNTFINFNDVGNITHMGGYQTAITSNGYRDTNTQWKSNAINSNTGAAQIVLHPTGEITFGTESNKANGSSWIVDTKLRITADGKMGLNTGVAGAYLDVNTDESLSAAAGIGQTIAQFRGAVGNDSQLEFKHVRLSNGTDWTTVATRIQKRIDSTDMGYIDFGTGGGTSGRDIAFGNGNREILRIKSSGYVGINSTGAYPLDVFEPTNNAGWISISGENTGYDTGFLIRNGTSPKWYLLNDVNGTDGHTFEIRGDGNNSDRFFTLTQAGDVGISHQKPSAGLHITKQGRNFSLNEFYDGYQSSSGLGGAAGSIAGSQVGERTHSLILESTTTAAADRGSSIGFRAKSGDTLVDVTYAAIVGAKENSVTNSDPNNSYDEQAKGYLSFYTSNQYAYSPHYGTHNIERMRITSGGQVLIGETSVAGGSQQLVVGNGGAENFEFTAGTSAQNGGVLEYIHRGDGSTRPDLSMYVAGGAFKVYTNGNNERLKIDSGGTTRLKRSDISNTATTANNAALYLDVADTEGSSSSYHLIGFGYRSAVTNAKPAFMGYQSTTWSGHTYGDLVFGTRNNTTGSNEASVRMRIKAGGDVQFSSNIVIANDQGISFVNADDTATGETVGSSVLDDYEEGSWTTLLMDGNGSNVTYSNSTAHYVKVGRMVYCYFNVTRAETGSKTGTMKFYNLPYLSTNSTLQVTGTWWLDEGSPSQNDAVGGSIYIQANTRHAYFVYPTSEWQQAGNRYLEFSQWQNGRPMYGSFTYEAAN